MMSNDAIEQDLTLIALAEKTSTTHNQNKKSSTEHMRSIRQRMSDLHYRREMELIEQDYDLSIQPNRRR